MDVPVCHLWLTEICEPLALASGLDWIGSRMIPAASAVGSQSCE
jgi:hypothetical protein